MASTGLPEQHAHLVGAASMTVCLLPDLERFWPSRRGHAFDEFCRAANVC